MKRTPLLRRSPLRSRRKRPILEEGRVEWKEPRAGFCECGCSRFSLHLDRHHVLTEQIVRREHGRVYDLANSMLLHRHCHANHTSASRKIPIGSVPKPALAFAAELLGEAAASSYFARRYGP